MSNYVGRFAPSPTGPLHFGSLVSALASFLDARHQRGTWLLRIEDLDPPRESVDAPSIIVQQLLAHGLRWDGDILYQHTRLPDYAFCVNTLLKSQHAYPCDCTRKKIAAVYSGTCRDKPRDAITDPYAYRLRIDNEQVGIDDRCLGAVSWDGAADVGDFIIKRKDGLFAYQLAVVVDDHFQGVTDIVRGADLLDSTPRQICLAFKLGYPQPRYLHHPLVFGDDGDKLSKQTHAAPVDLLNPTLNLRRALTFLGQPPVPDSIADVQGLLAQAVQNWQVALIPKSRV